MSVSIELLSFGRVVLLLILSHNTAFSQLKARQHLITGQYVQRMEGGQAIQSGEREGGKDRNRKGGLCGGKWRHSVGLGGGRFDVLLGRVDQLLKSTVLP